MGVKKFKNLFSKGSAQKSLSASHTKKEDKMEPTKSRDPKTKQNNVHDKQAIEQLRKLISGKFKDPAAAKKAAQIIEQMINPSKK